MGLQQDLTSVPTLILPPALILPGASSEGEGGCDPPPSLLLLLFLNKLQAGWCPGKFLAALWLLELEHPYPRDHSCRQQPQECTAKR